MAKLVLELYDGLVCIVDNPDDVEVELRDFDLGQIILDNNETEDTELAWDDQTPFVRRTL